ncbi:MAG: AraC family transcriptional regulator [Actinomycetota bacterium]
MTAALLAPPPFPDPSAVIGSWSTSSVAVLSAAGVRRAIGESSSVEPARCHVLLLPTAGRGTHQVDFRPCRLEPGLALHVQPGQAHRWDAAGRTRARVVLIHPDLCPPGLFSIADPQPEVPLGPAASVVAAVAADLDREQRATNPDRAVMATSAALLLQHVARARTRGIGQASPSQLALLRSFRAELERSFTASRSVAEYARRIGTSPKTLSRATGGLTGHSPKELIDRRVILEARRLLASSTESASAIGARLGFSEPTNFTKFFARHTGTSPQEFRAEI